MSSERSVALVLDNPLRDLIGLTLVASELARTGTTCHLVPMNLIDTELRALAPDAVLLNYLRPSNVRVVRQMIAAGIVLHVLDTEGGVLVSMDAYDRTLADDPAVCDHVASFCTWGSVVADHLVATSRFTAAQVVVTGAPRFDVYAPRWRGVTVPQDRRRPMVLVNGNFPIANPGFKSPSEEHAMLVRDFGWTRAEATRAQDGQQATLEHMCALTRSLASRRPEIDLVYRPHPFERLSTYADEFAGLPNVTVTRDGGVESWILSAVAVIQRSCTTAIDAALSDVPALSPTWIPTPFDMVAAETVSVACPSPEVLDQALDSVLDGTFERPSEVSAGLESITRDWFHVIDGLAHKRVADVLRQRVGDGRPVSADRVRDLVGAPEPGVQSRVRTALKRRMSPDVRTLGRRRRQPSWTNSEKAFHAEDVQAVLDRIARVDPTHGGVQAVSTRSIGRYTVPMRHGRSVTVSRPD